MKIQRIFIKLFGLIALISGLYGIIPMLITGCFRYYSQEPLWVMYFLTFCFWSFWGTMLLVKDSYYEAKFRMGALIDIAVGVVGLYIILTASLNHYNFEVKHSDQFFECLSRYAYLSIAYIVFILNGILVLLYKKESAGNSNKKTITFLGWVSTGVFALAAIYEVYVLSHTTFNPARGYSDILISSSLTVLFLLAGVIINTYLDKNIIAVKIYMGLLAIIGIVMTVILLKISHILDFSPRGCIDSKNYTLATIALILFLIPIINGILVQFYKKEK
ncbi:MAG: hypothetical protein A2044_02215 [Candidatus Firestonebacteria bacterium GWA2_43_8]|nr:MAG: hypothetical protein A2044_02215 [Candidatus Firestonebacteria bacterium GWA2_43_8]